MTLSTGDHPRAHAILLDTVRSQPSAYAWSALAENWLVNPPPFSSTKVSNKISKKNVSIVVYIQLNFVYLLLYFEV